MRPRSVRPRPQRRVLQGHPLQRKGGLPWRASDRQPPTSHSPSTRPRPTAPGTDGRRTRRICDRRRSARRPARVLGRRELPDRRADLPARQRAAARAAARRARQAAAARALGHLARAEPRLRAPQPAHPPDRSGGALRRRTGPRRPGGRRQRLPRGHLLRGLPARLGRRGRHARARAPVLHARRDPEPRQRADARLDPRGRRARLRAHARVRRRVRQPGPARRVRDRRRRGRDRRRSRAPGRASASSTPSTTARCCRSCTSTSTRSRGRPCSAARRRRTCSRCCAATATPRASSPATTRRTVHRAFAAALDAAHDEIRAIQHAARDRRRARLRNAALAGDRAAHAEGLDRPARGRRHARSRGRFARIRCRSRACARTRRTSRCSSAGCAATAPRSSSTTTAGSSPSSPPSRPRAIGAWARSRTPTAGGCSKRSTCPTPPPTRWR